MAKIEGMMEQMRDGFNHLNTRLNNIENHIESRFGSIESRLNHIESRLDQKVDKWEMRIWFLILIIIMTLLKLI